LWDVSGYAINVV